MLQEADDVRLPHDPDVAPRGAPRRARSRKPRPALFTSTFDLVDPVREPLDGVGVRDVQLDGGGSDLGGQFLEPVDPAGSDDDLESLFHEASGGGRSDPARCARYDRGFASGVLP